MVPGIVVLTCEPCLAFLYMSSGSFRTGCPRSDGSSRLSVRQSEKSGEQGSYVPRSEGREVRVESRAQGRPSDRRPSEDGWSPNRALRLDRWAEIADERVLLFLGLAFWLVAGPPLCPVVFRLLGRALAQNPIPEGPRLYEPDSSKLHVILMFLDTCRFRSLLQKT